MTDFREQCIGKAKLIGTFAAIPHPVAVEVTAQSGLDFVCIDWEHAQIARDTIENMVRAADVHRVPAIVRVPGHAPEAIAAALDSGAQGVLVPRVSTAAQATMAARRRRAIRRRASAASGPGGPPATATASSNISPAPMRKSSSRSRWRPPKGSRTSTRSRRPDGVDLVFVGPGDLSVSIDAIGPAGAAGSLEAIETIIGAALAHDKVAGIFCARPEDVGRMGRQGRQLLHPGERHDVSRRRRRGQLLPPHANTLHGRSRRADPPTTSASCQADCVKHFFKLKTFALKSAALRIAFRCRALLPRSGAIAAFASTQVQRVQFLSFMPPQSSSVAKARYAFDGIRAQIRDLHTETIANLALRARELGDVIALWYGEGDMVTPAFIRDAAKAALDEGLDLLHPEHARPWAADRGAVGLPEAPARPAHPGLPHDRHAGRHAGALSWRSSCWSIPGRTSSMSRRNGRTSTTPST